MSRMNNAWNTIQPNAKPRAYSRATSRRPVRHSDLIACRDFPVKTAGFCKRYWVGSHERIWSPPTP
jgi:hypothetical protein